MASVLATTNILDGRSCAKSEAIYQTLTIKFSNDNIGTLINNAALIHYYLLLIFTSTNQNGLRTQPTFTCSKLTIETIGQGVKYVQS